MIAGRTTRTVVPLPCFESISISPPASRTMPEGHREPEAGPALVALGRKEGLEHFVEHRPRGCPPLVLAFQDHAAASSSKSVRSLTPASRPGSDCSAFSRTLTATWVSFWKLALTRGRSGGQVRDEVARGAADEGASSREA